MMTTAAVRRRREFQGPALLSYGFRPFFLGAALWAALGVLLWLPQYFGEMRVPTHLGALDWHVHEMLYGYAPATIAGFLLTAIPNWTGRLPVNGPSLGALVALWLAGRVALLVSASFGPLAAAIDLTFLIALAAVAAVEIVAGKNWRNLRVLLVLSVLIAGNIVFHAEVLLRGSADYGIRIGLAAILMLIALVGGRIVPSFTNNWLTRNNPGRLPIPFSRFDAATVGLSALALFAWIAAPAHPVAGAILIAAGVCALGRLQHIGVEDARLLHRNEMGLGKFGGGELLCLEPRARVRDREVGELGHSGASHTKPGLAFGPAAAGASAFRATPSSPISVTSHCQGCAMRFACSTASR